jgi:hypothetical protein
MMSEMNWHPENDDPAYEEGVAFAQRCPETPVGYHWLVRQAFWAGVHWDREQRSMPISGKVMPDGHIEWRNAL